MNANVLARARTKRRARSEGPRAHAETRAEGRRNGLQSAAAAGAKFETGVGAGKMGAEPVSASGTLRIDALHGPTGQILHARVLRWPPFPVAGFPRRRDELQWREFCAGEPLVSREKHYKMLWWGCGVENGDVR